MKEKLIVAFLILHTPVAAQPDLPQFVISSSGVEPVTLSFADRSADEIKQGVQNWYQTIFLDPDHLGVSGVRHELLHIHGTMENVFALPANGGPDFFDVEYDLEIRVLENKVILTLQSGQLWWHPFRKKADFTVRRFFNADGAVREVFAEAKKSLERALNDWVPELYLSIKYGWTTRMRRTPEGPAVLTEAEKNAEPSGGFSEFYEFMTQTIRYPEQARRSGIAGKVIVKFVVESTGYLTNFEIVQPLFKDCDRELVRVLKLGPNWEPAQNGGVKIRQSCTMPFVFGLK
jgi:TonB family protein